MRAVMGCQPSFLLQSVAKALSASWRIFNNKLPKASCLREFIILQYRCGKIFISLLPKFLIDDILIVLQIVDITITQLSSDKESKAIKT